MPLKDSSRFYADLPVLDSFFEVSNQDNYHALPADWYVGVTDIVDSTQAIENEQYKWVNMLGASPIVGILNKNGQKGLPYSFGGDGCIVCFPPDLLEEARNVFTSSQAIGLAEYDLELRAAIFPMHFIRQKGYEVNVSRFRISDFYSQAVFTGGGLNYADQLLKSAEDSPHHLSPGKSYAGADFTGLECRWQEVRPPDKSVITLLIRANPTHDFPEEVYERVLKKMRTIFGFDDKTNPILTSELNMNMSISGLLNEMKFRTFGKKWFHRAGYLLKAELQILLGKCLMFFGYETSATDWSRYKSDLTQHSDHRKFDDMLRLVISGTPAQCKKLELFLQEQFDQSALAYGLHITESALITCMVFAYQQKHIHFVDGSDGGYVKASIGLKKRMKQLKETTH